MFLCCYPWSFCRYTTECFIMNKHQIHQISFWIRNVCDWNDWSDNAMYWAECDSVKKNHNAHIVQFRSKLDQCFMCTNIWTIEKIGLLGVQGMWMLRGNNHMRADLCTCMIPITFFQSNIDNLRQNTYNSINNALDKRPFLHKSIEMFLDDPSPVQGLRDIFKDCLMVIKLAPGSKSVSTVVLGAP